MDFISSKFKVLKGILSASASSSSPHLAASSSLRPAALLTSSPMGSLRLSSFFSTATASASAFSPKISAYPSSYPFPLYSICFNPPTSRNPMAGPFKPNLSSPAATIPSPAEPSRKVKVLCSSPILIRSQLPNPKQHQLVSVSSAEDLDECDGLPEYDRLLEHSEYGSTDTFSGFSEDSGQGYVEPINQNQATASEPVACRIETARTDRFIDSPQHQLSQPATALYFSASQNHTPGLVENYTSDSFSTDQNPFDIYGCIPTDMFIEDVLLDVSDMDDLLEEIAMTVGS